MRSGFLRRAAAALAQRMVRGYPQPWRERYEGEVLTLLEDSPARMSDVLDLARGLLVERVRALFEPGDRPVLLATLVSLVGFARALTIAAPPVIAGWAAHQFFGPAPRAVERFAIVAVVVFVLALVALRLIRRYWPTTTIFEPGKPRLSERAGLVYIGLVMPIAFLTSWSADHILQALSQLWLFAPVWHQMAPRQPWHVEMVRAVQQLWTARQELDWSARMELERCERLVADGMPAPLQEARDAVADLEQRREEALATLHRLGYRASLQNPGTPNSRTPNSRTLNRT